MTIEQFCEAVAQIVVRSSEAVVKRAVFKSDEWRVGGLFVNARLYVMCRVVAEIDHDDRAHHIHGHFNQNGCDVEEHIGRDIPGIGRGGFDEGIDQPPHGQDIDAVRKSRYYCRGD